MSKLRAFFAKFSEDLAFDLMGEESNGDIEMQTFKVTPDAAVVTQLEKQYAPLLREGRHALAAVQRQMRLAETNGATRDLETALAWGIKSLDDAIKNGDADTASNANLELPKIIKRVGELPKPNKHKDQKRAEETVAARDKQQASLGNASGTLAKCAGFPEKAALVIVCAEYEKLLAAGQKNSTENLAALDRLLKALPQPVPAELRDTIDPIKAAAEAEHKSLTETRAMIDKLLSGKGSMSFDPSPLGDPGTQAEQAKALKVMMEAEAARSNAFVALLAEIDRSSAKLEMMAAKGSCAAFDSFNDGTMDASHFDALPDEPASIDGKKVGVTKGEILVHVLEERLYSRQKCKGDDAHYHGCKDYNGAHNKCLAPGSFQNLYRRERGQGSDTIQLTNDKTKSGETGFQQVASDGAKATTPIQGINLPGFVADPKRVEYDTSESDGYETVLNRFRATAEKKFRNGKFIGKDGKYDAAAVKTEDTEDWQIWLAEQFGDRTKANKVVTEEFQTLGEKYEKQRKADQQRVAEQSKKANDHLNTKKDAELDPGSLYLRQCRNSRGNVNLAAAEYTAFAKRREGMTPEEVEQEKGRVPIMRNTERENCAVTTLGAITSGSSSDFVKGWMTDHDMKDVADICAAFQGDDMWAYIEEGGVPNGLPNDFEGVRGELNGDAQLRGIRKAMLKEAEKRNRDGGLEFQVVQDGLNDTGSMYSADELAARMAKYPDGTQFEVFIAGDMKHWIYAEKFDGKVIFEDYQLTSKEQKEPTAKLADGGPPDNPMSGVGNSFSEGMFIAIAPIKKGDAVPEHKTDPNWPEPGSEDDRALADTTSRMSRAKSPTAVAEVLEKNKKFIKLEWCGVDEVAAAIRSADEAFKALKEVIRTRDEQAILIKKHHEALPKIRAGHKQIDHLLLQHALLPLQNPVFGVVLESGDAELLKEIQEYWRGQKLPADIDGLLAELKDAKHAGKIPEKDAQIFTSLRDRVPPIQALMRDAAWASGDFSAMNSAYDQLSNARRPPLSESIKLISIEDLKLKIDAVIIRPLDEEFDRLKKKLQDAETEFLLKKEAETRDAFDWDGEFAKVMTEYNNSFKAAAKAEYHAEIAEKLTNLNRDRTTKAFDELTGFVDDKNKLVKKIQGSGALTKFTKAIKSLEAGVKA